MADFFQTSFTDITGALGDLFGTSQSGKQSASESGTSKTTEKYTFSQDALDKIIKDVLSSEGGLADIFNEENISGLYDSTVAKDATGNLVAKIIGEVAKLQATKTTDTVSKTKSSGKTKAGSDGLLDGVLGSVGKVFGF